MFSKMNYKIELIGFKFYKQLRYLYSNNIYFNE